jgi:protocatechuate 3,4-dioxygenase beta subunit
MLFRRLVMFAISTALLSSVGATEQPSAPQRPSRDNPSQMDARPAPAGRITGRVLAADSGRPVRRALVRATAPELPGGRAVFTDDSGAFDLAALPAGRYAVSASKIGFVPLAYGQRRPLQPGTPFQLAEAQHLRGVDFRLPRGSAIAGRIVDEDGEPLPGAVVRVMRYQYAQGARQLAPAGSGQTDDKGQYRVWGLNPGDYYVSAIARNVNMFGRGRGAVGPAFAPGGRDARAGTGPVGGPVTPDDGSDEVGYAPTFYPGVASASDARAVTVGLGAEALDIDFGILLVRTSDVSGHVVNADGTPASAGSVNLVAEGGAGRTAPGQGYGGRVRGDGVFSIAGVPPGRYTLRARREGRAAPAFGTLPITVTGIGDVTDVVVTLAAGAMLAGSVSLQATQSAEVPDLGQFRISAPPADPGGFGGGGNVRADAEGRFALENVPGGLRWIRAQAPRGWMLKSALVDGREVLDEPLDVRAGQRISGITLVFTDRLSEINGTISGEQGTPVTELTVVAFSTDPGFWRQESRHIGTARPDQTGTFQLRGLPPGEYFVAAVDPAEPGEWFEPSFLDQHRLGAARLILGEGEVKTHDIRIPDGDPRARRADERHGDFGT